jgi:transcription-repair coupling factor (superfamily II helicase)
LPEHYVSDEGQRLAYYKKLASAENEDRVESLAAELIDRFGPLPKEALPLIDGMTAKALCRLANINGLDVKSSQSVLYLNPEDGPSPERVQNLIHHFAGRLRFSKDFKLTFIPAGSESCIRQTIALLRLLCG